MNKTTDYYALNALAQGLNGVSERLEAKEAASHAAKAAQVLVAALTKTTDSHALDSLSEGLRAVSERLESGNVWFVMELFVIMI
jgi:hypothetical protein